MGIYIGITWQIWLNDYALQQFVGLTLGVATQPFPKLVWANYFIYC